jgi:hypothetical protein
LTSSDIASIGGSIDFNWSSKTGAILVLPQGAARETLRNSDFAYHYVAKNCAKWFSYACERRRTQDPGSLYFVTGHHKTNAYGLATVSDTSNSGSLKFCATAPVVQGSASIGYTWVRCGAAIPRAGPEQPSDNKNQCVFVSGFTITKKKVFGTKLLKKVKITDIAGAKMQDPADPYTEQDPDPSDNTSGNEDPVPEDGDDNAMVVDSLSPMTRVRIFCHIPYSI